MCSDSVEGVILATCGIVRYLIKFINTTLGIIIPMLETKQLSIEGCIFIDWIRILLFCVHSVVFLIFHDSRYVRKIT